VRSLGIDVGSRYVKFAIYDNNSVASDVVVGDAVAFTGKMDTIGFYREASEAAVRRHGRRQVGNPEITGILV